MRHALSITRDLVAIGRNASLALASVSSDQVDDFFAVWDPKPDDMCGIWSYGPGLEYTITKENDKLLFCQLFPGNNSVRGELVVDGTWLVAQLHIGQVRLKRQGEEMISNFPDWQHCLGKQASIEKAWRSGQDEKAKGHAIPNSWSGAYG